MTLEEFKNLKFGDKLYQPTRDGLQVYTFIAFEPTIMYNKLLNPNGEFPYLDNTESKQMDLGVYFIIQHQFKKCKRQYAIIPQNFYLLETEAKLKQANIYQKIITQLEVQVSELSK